MNNCSSKIASSITDIQDDGLEHDALAASILGHAKASVPGTIIALQGSWGRGKTDVLKRMQVVLNENESDTFVTDPIWLNPWQYGTADLLTPMVIELIKRINPKKISGKPALMEAIKSLLRAGTAIGLKSASIVAPAGGLFEAAIKPADSLISGLFKALELQEKNKILPDFDPVAAMAVQFSTLVDEYLKVEGNIGKRIIICVDDIDRCLPDRQVAMLEALHFLTSTEVKAVFLVAIDPTLASQAIVTHFGTKNFDPDRYLDKLFSLRSNLPTLSLIDVERFVGKILDRVILSDKRQMTFREFCRTGIGDLGSEVIQDMLPLFQLPDFNNPRIIKRIFNRIYLSAIQRIQIQTSDEKNDEFLKCFFLWIVLSERYPAIRSVLQAIYDEQHFSDIFTLIYNYYSFTHENQADLSDSVLSLLPDPEILPNIKTLFEGFINPERMSANFFRIDGLLRVHGL